jgi:hypothetical protein
MSENKSSVKCFNELGGGDFVVEIGMRGETPEIEIDEK